MLALRRLFFGCGIVLCLGLCACQLTTTASLDWQIQQTHQNRNGLLPPIVDKQVAITCSVPPYWQELPLKKTLLYSHQQWRSPDRRTGMGVAYFHTPVPMSPQSVIWFAKGQYTQGAAKDPNAKLIGQWSDSAGRAWFEAENSQYHIRGYAMTRGFQAWIVYSGYRVKTMPETEEIDLAERAANTVMPAGNSE